MGTNPFSRLLVILLGPLMAGFLAVGLVFASHSADLTGDGRVDQTDVNILMSLWRGSGSADLNHDGTVSATDAGILFSNWGTLPTPPPPPPPSGIFNPDLGAANAHWDNFDRPDNADLGTIASFVWRSWLDYQGDLRITGNRVVSAAPTVWSFVRLVWGGLSVPSDHWIEADLKVVASGDTGMIAVRKEDNTDRDFYGLQWKAEASGPVLKIVKWVGGVETVLASMPFGKLGETHKFQLGARGSTLIAFADDQEKLRVTDITYPSTNLYQWISIGLLGNAELDRFRLGQYANTFAPPSGATYRSGTRNPWEWPYDQNSVWNRPIGSGAAYTPPVGGIANHLKNNAFSFNITAWSTNVFLAQTTDPIGGIYNSSPVYGGWHELGRINIPANAAPSIGTDAHIVIVEPNQEYAWETSGAKRCLDGICGEGIRRFRLRDSGRYTVFHGSTEQGQSGMLGLIRKGELTNGIFHVLNGVFWPHLLNDDYVWPGNSVGDFTCTGCGGPADQTANVRHGTLLAIPSSVNLDTLGITHPKAKVIARALQDYGVYVTDKGGNMVFRAEGSTVNEFPVGGGTEWNWMTSDMLKASKFLQVVSNNGPNAVGGGGVPRAPLPPPFAP